jgi:hypothetical protein
VVVTARAFKRGLTFAADFRDAGYPEAMLGETGHHQWQEMHKWCKQNFGRKYTWCGSNFFFVNEHDRLMFVLRWS